MLILGLFDANNSFTPDLSMASVFSKPTENKISSIIYFKPRTSRTTDFLNMRSSRTLFLEKFKKDHQGHSGVQCEAFEVT